MGKGQSFLQRAELFGNQAFLAVGETILKPFKIMAERVSSPRGPLSVHFLNGVPQVVLDELTSDGIDVHVQRPATLVRHS